MSEARVQPIAVNAGPFEDTIDGYFPLSESLRQMMVRQGFASAVISILHAPIIELPGLAPSDPVPLYITDGHAGMIHSLAVYVRMTGDGLTVEGWARWSWVGGHRAEDETLSMGHRLAEPAFVRGVGVSALDAIGSVAEGGPGSNGSLMAADAYCWRVGNGDGVRRGAATRRFGTVDLVGAGQRDTLCVRAASPRDRRILDALVSDQLG